MKLSRPLSKLTQLSYISIAALGLAACEPEAQSPFTELPELQGSSQVLALENGWVSASEEHGVRFWQEVEAEDGSLAIKPNSQIKANAEFLDSRNGLAQFDQVIASLDKASNSIVLISPQDGKLNLIHRVKDLPFIVDGFCLYQDPQKQLHLFVLDGRGQGQQRLVLGRQGEALNQRVRDLPLGANASNCSANDSEQTLYVSEESYGVWAMPANPETAAERELLAGLGATPWLSSSSAGISFFGSGLAILEPETAKLHLLYNDGSHTEMPIPGASEPENLRYSHQQQALIIADDEGKIWQLPLSGRENTPAQPSFHQVQASAETHPVPVFGDVADDPAIWFNRHRPGDSLILGANKKGGLHIYELNGKERQFIPSGRLNNVDLRYGFKLQDRLLDIAVASRRDDNSLAIFTIDNGQLTQLGTQATDLAEIYGLCMYQAPDRKLYVFANDKDGSYQQFRLKARGPRIVAEAVRAFRLPGQPEGCAAHDSQQQLFMGEEDKGIWLIGANPEDGAKAKMIVNVGDHLQKDVEGMSIYRGRNHSYLVVSSQGNNSYAVYETAKPYRYRGSFEVAMNAQAGIDGSSETDGLDVSSANFGGPYSQGMLVVQDGYNSLPTQPQNFKIISWQPIKEALGLE